MRKLLLAAALAGGLGLAVSGCGGSGAPAVANLRTTTATRSTTTGPASNGAPSGAGAQPSGGKVGVAFTLQGSVQQMTTFVACMRANGEPSFPNPNAQGILSAGSLDRGSPQFNRALDACRKDLPGGIPTPAQQERDLRQAVAFSICMRRNGEPNYPDPIVGSDGGTAVHLLNVDQSSPQFQRAEAVCKSREPGVTKG